MLTIRQTFRELKGRPVLKLILVAVVFTIVLLQCRIHLDYTKNNKPYEGWDEISTYNSSHIVSGPLEKSVFHYGHVETFIQWCANVYYEYFDYYGNSFPHIRYSNNFFDTLNDQYSFFQDESIKRDEGGVSYDFFRGVDDRTPIFISRSIHIVVLYVILSCLCIDSLVNFGPRGPVFALSAQCLLLTSEVYFQFTQSLPTALSGTLIFAMLIQIFFYFLERKSNRLCIAAVLLAIAVNTKLDAIIFIPYFVLACGYDIFIYRQQALRSCLISFLAFTASFVVIRPGVIFNPAQDFRRFIAYGISNSTLGTLNLHDRLLHVEKNINEIILRYIPALHENIGWSVSVKNFYLLSFAFLCIANVFLLSYFVAKGPLATIGANCFGMKVDDSRSLREFDYASVSMVILVDNSVISPTSG